MLPDVPQLVESGQLEIRDITGEIRQDANFAIVFRDRILKDHFPTQAAARLFIHRHLIAPAQLMRERADALEEWPSGMDQPSRAVH